MEGEIFIEIKKAEERADEIARKASADSGKLLAEAKNKTSTMLMKGMEQIDREKAEKIQQFREKIHLLRDTKVSEGNEAVRKLRQKAQKNKDSAVDFITEKFYEMVRA